MICQNLEGVVDATSKGGGGGKGYLYKESYELH
jgi:hypothetical protein